MSMADGSPGIIVGIDTATAEAIVTLGDTDGRLVASTTWLAGFRHGEELLPRLDALLQEAGIARSELSGVAVGTGPGAFTGLRVGIATAKGLAHGLGLPILGIATSSALLAAARTGGLADPIAILLPAGPKDRVVITTDSAGTEAQPRRIGVGEAWQPGEAVTVAAIDLDGRASDDELAAGARARVGFATAMIALAATRLRSGDVDDLATLVPVYVTQPRGVVDEANPGLVAVVPG